MRTKSWKLTLSILRLVGGWSEEGREREGKEREGNERREKERKSRREREGEGGRGRENERERRRKGGSVWRLRRLLTFICEGYLSAELKEALGITPDLVPPPWLINMQVCVRVCMCVCMCVFSLFLFPSNFLYLYLHSSPSFHRGTALRLPTPS